MLFNHVAIQVNDLENTLSWYQYFFKCKINWELTKFSQLTIQRLPGIRKIIEIENDFFRFHLFDRINTSPIERNCIQYQHICFSVDNPIKIDKIKKEWQELFDSKKFRFADNSHITDKIVDGKGVESLYFTDVNGLEFEVTYIPCKK